MKELVKVSVLNIILSSLTAAPLLVWADEVGRSLVPSEPEEFTPPEQETPPSNQISTTLERAPETSTVRRKILEVGTQLYYFDYQEIFPAHSGLKSTESGAVPGI